MRVDPFFQDVPWEIIKDEDGQVLGEVFILLPAPPPRRRQLKRGTSLRFVTTLNTPQIFEEVDSHEMGSF